MSQRPGTRAFPPDRLCARRLARLRPYGAHYDDAASLDDDHGVGDCIGPRSVDEPCVDVGDLAAGLGVHRARRLEHGGHPVRRGSRDQEWQGPGESVCRCLEMIELGIDRFESRELAAFLEPGGHTTPFETRDRVASQGAGLALVVSNEVGATLLDPHLADREDGQSCGLPCFAQ